MFYILLLFTSLLYLFFASDFQSNLPSEIDFKKEYGTKTTGKISLILISKTSNFFLFSIFILALITIVPLSLDSFNYYSEEALENLWSFEEVLNLETILLFYLSLFSQIPIIVFSFLTNENYLLLFPRIGRVILFLAIVIALRSASIVCGSSHKYPSRYKKSAPLKTLSSMSRSLICEAQPR